MSEEQAQEQAQPVPETQDHQVTAEEAIRQAQEALAAWSPDPKPEPDDTQSMEPVQDDGEGEDGASG